MPRPAPTPSPGVLWAAWDAGLGTCGVVASPIAGTHGNAEFIAHFRTWLTAPGAGAIRQNG